VRKSEQMALNYLNLRLRLFQTCRLSRRSYRRRPLDPLRGCRC